MQNNWGKNAWCLLHNISFNLEKNKIKEFQKFLNLYGDTLPCVVCKEHFKKNTDIIPIEIIDNKDNNPGIWSFNMHNLVNAEIGKKQLNYNEMLEYKKINKEDHIKEYIKLLVNNLNNDISPSFEKIIKNIRLLKYINELETNKNIKIYSNNHIIELKKKYF